jgi:sortase A
VSDKERPANKRRALTAAAVVLAVAGIALIVYPFATDLWAAHLQGGLTRELASSEREYRSGHVPVGHALTRLQIPKLGVDVVVVQGTTQAALHAGAGHYPNTPLPGEPGNVAIAGHRTTYGKPFARLNELKPGDRVILTTPVGRYDYRVTGAPWVVKADDWSPVKVYPKKGSFLTLTSCHPEGSAAYRIVARAKLVSS